MAMSPRLLRPRATGFSPKSISGLALWLDPTDSSSMTIDTGVSVISDKSGNARNFASSVGNNQPTLTTIAGKTALNFNGTSHRLFAADAAIQTSLTGSMSLFIVFEATFPGNAAVVFNQFMSTGISERNNFNMALRADQGAEWLFGTLRTRATSIRTGGNTNADQRFDSKNVSGRSLATMSAAFATTSVTQTSWHNNTSASSTAGTSDANSAVGLGIGFRNGTTPDQFYVGKIGEVVAYSSELSTLQRLAVQSYLARKWSITLA
jgi:hypothetical protein